MEQSNSKKITESKEQTLNRLFTENGLLPQDVHKHNHYTILTRSGIEKVMAKNDVTARYEVCFLDHHLVVIKGYFSKPGVPDVETFGSASDQTSKTAYYAEMAEKRCMSRGVLKICNLYEYNVKGEDESEDFKQKTGEVELPVTQGTSAVSYGTEDPAIVKQKVVDIWADRIAGAQTGAHMDELAADAATIQDKSIKELVRTAFNMRVTQLKLTRQGNKYVTVEEAAASRTDAGSAAVANAKKSL